MQKDFTVKSYAKINLHLHVGNLRPDRFHEIFSLFQSITLHDIIKITSHTAQDIGIPIIVNGSFSCKMHDNLIYKAAAEYMKASGIKDSLVIEVQKIIPEGAGLGGGSSNAAAVLNGLDHIFKHLPLKKSLEHIAADIGSDVPFFLKGGTAIVSGRGENISFIKQNSSEKHNILLVYPGFKISTPDAYKWLDAENENRIKADEKNEISDIKSISELLHQRPSKWSFYNSFTDLIIKKYSDYKKIIEIYTENNADFISITGSGSSIFAVFEDHGKIEKAFNTIKAYYQDAWITGYMDSPASLL